MLRVGESKGSEKKLDPTTQIPEMLFGHKPISPEPVTAGSAKSHAGSHQRRLKKNPNFLVKGKKSLTTWNVRN